MSTGGWDRTSPFCICGQPLVDGDCSRCDEDPHVAAARDQKISDAYNTRYKLAKQEGFSDSDCRDHARAEAERVRREQQR